MRSLYITLSGYFALLILLITWHGFLFPAARQPWLILIFIIAPLLFPLRGLLKENPYTYAWTSFVILLYFIHGVVEAWANDNERIYAVIEIYLSIQVYIGAIYYARLQGRALKQQE
ncbi:MAG: DUF2069 domain-containing protein [Gammaproteobacteria bacterium]|nr:DUF2069 domain-containing protein [Gammaproteobacteria bacterium]MCW8988747.1 DUF2069 domain-containing protein [Gammaproteobacteria bacterium]MCW9030635.1 DUF2069 domain-containing protein [Gammaproteobacteria bacterium]